MTSVPAPEWSWRPELRTLWGVWGDQGGISMYGDDFRGAYEDWESAHILGFASISGRLYRQRRLIWLGFTVYTPWRLYAVDPARERYRRAVN